MNTDVQIMRAKIVAFLQGKQLVDKTTIKAHLKLEPLAYNTTLEKALKTVKIKVTKAHPQVSTLNGKPLYLATPINLYSPIS